MSNGTQPDPPELEVAITNSKSAIKVAYITLIAGVLVAATPIILNQFFNWRIFEVLQYGVTKKEAISIAQNAAKYDSTGRSTTVIVDIPSGVVAAFDLSSCPSGWQAFDDGKGRMIVGVGEGNVDENNIPLSPRSLGDKGGEEQHRLTVEEMPDHKHDTNLAVRPTEANWGRASSKKSIAGSSALERFETGYTQNVGKGSPHNNMPPYIALLYCRKD